MTLALVALLGCSGPSSAPPSAPSEPAVEDPAEPIRVALTLDDVPWQTGEGGAAEVSDPARQLRATETLIGHLEDMDAPAAVYVNCDGLAGEPAPILRWKEAGFDVGNHTATHADLNAVLPAVWEDGVRRCHGVLEKLLGEPPHSFRYPYLHRGDTDAKRAFADDLIGALGVPDAPVTTPTSEWLLAQLYAATDDPVRREEIGEAYVEHMVEAVRQGRAVASRCRGEDVPHITLAHVNQLNVDWLDDVLAAFAREGIELIPLDQALAHPIYAAEDLYVGPASPSWLGRVTPSCDVSWFGRQESRIQRRLGTTPPAGEGKEPR